MPIDRAIGAGTIRSAHHRTIQRIGLSYARGTGFNELLVVPDCEKFGTAAVIMFGTFINLLWF